MAAKTVYVELVAQTKKFNAGLKKADKGLSRTQKMVGGVSAAVIALGAVALRQVSREINAISAELDELAKTARALNTDFNFFEDLQFVMKRLGATGGVGVIKKTMLAVSKATAEAASGSAEYVDEFKALNIPVKEFIKLDPEAQFLALQNAYSTSAQGAREQNALQIIAGRGAKALLNVFAAQSEEVVGLIQQRRKLGGFSEEAGNLAEEFEDVKTNVEQVKRGLKDQLFLSLAPTFIAASKGMQRFVTWLREAGLVGPVVKGTIAAIVVAMGAATAASISLTVALLPISLAAVAIGAAIGGLIVGIGTLIVYWDDLKIAIRDFGDVAGPILDKVTAFGGEIFRVLGFGDDSSAARAAAAPAPVPAGISTSSVANTTVVQNYNISGMTAEQMESKARREAGAASRGKRR